MRFTDKTFFQYKDEFLQNFSLDNEYVVYGVGENYIYIKELFKNELKIAYCIDKRANEIMDCDYITYTPDYLKTHPLGMKKIIIMPTSSMYDEIKKYLGEIGIESDKYCSSQELLLMWGWYYHHKIYSMGVNCFLTTRCTLSCKACSQLTPYLKKKKDIDLDMVIQSIDDYFLHFDKVKDFILVGGETFLYNDLGYVCKYVSDKYSDRYGMLKIFSNGTIILDKSVLKILEDIDNVCIFLSDYSPIIGGKSKIKYIKHQLDKARIKCIINSNFGQTEQVSKWFDLGNPFTKKHRCLDEVKKVFNKCSLVCNNLYDSKVFYCVPSASAYIGNIFTEINNDEYLNLAIEEDDKLELMALKNIRFQLGFIPKGYVDFCMNCNGYGTSVNSKLLPAGEQSGD